MRFILRTSISQAKSWDKNFSYSERGYRTISYWNGNTNSIFLYMDMSMNNICRYSSEWFVN